MIKSLQLHLLFYRNFAVATVCISFFGCFLILEAGTILFAIPIAMMKVITNGLIGVMVHFLKRNQLYFFHNLGISTVPLYVVSFAIDMSVWLIMICLTYAIL